MNLSLALETLWDDTDEDIQDQPLKTIQRLKILGKRLQLVVYKSNT